MIKVPVVLDYRCIEELIKKKAEDMVGYSNFDSCDITIRDGYRGIIFTLEATATFEYLTDEEREAREKLDVLGKTHDDEDFTPGVTEDNPDG
jgi:hypothetical protein